MNISTIVKTLIFPFKGFVGLHSNQCFDVCNRVFHFSSWLLCVVSNHLCVCALVKELEFAILQSTCAISTLLKIMEQYLSHHQCKRDQRINVMTTVPV